MSNQLRKSIDERLSEVAAEFKKIRILHPRVTDVQNKLAQMRLTGRKSVGQPQRILPIIGPPASGKSTTILAMIEREKGEHQPILHVTLSANASVKQLALDIVRALDKSAPPLEVMNDAIARGQRRTLREADDFGRLSQANAMYIAATALKNACVELLILDEIHHLIHSDGAKATAWSVTETLKKLADSGVCPIVVVGISSALRLVDATNNRQFSVRCDTPILLAPLDYSVKEQRQLFIGFIAALDNKLVEHGIFSKSSHLVEGDFPACFYDLSKGVIGEVSKLVEQAADLAIRRGRDAIDIQDLSDAVENWAMPLSITDYNPWRNGPRDFKVLKVKKS